MNDMEVVREKIEVDVLDATGSSIGCEIGIGGGYMSPS